MAENIIDLKQPKTEAGNDLSDHRSNGAILESEKQRILEAYGPNQTKNAANSDNGQSESAANSDKDQAELQRLAGLSPLDYDRERNDAAKRMNCRVSSLDELVGELRKGQRQRGEVDELFSGIEPWDQSVSGVAIADEIKALLHSHTKLSVEAENAITLWVLGSYTFDNFRIFPKLCLSSPEKRCGKTTTLEVIGATVRQALMCSNTSAATIYRAIEAWKPALVIDEADTFIHGNEELRGIVNSGHTRSTAYVLRVEESNGQFLPKRYSTWAPMCIAMIKTPPSTILDRSVLIPLRRKLVNEKTTKLPMDLMEQCQKLRRQCQRWANDKAIELRQSNPAIPSMTSDRAQDNWIPLLAIANAIGGDWSKYGVEAATLLERKDDDDEGAGPMILMDIKNVFEDQRASRLHSNLLVEKLVAMEERPWCEWKGGKPLTMNTLARLLKPFNIKSKQLKVNGNNRYGFEFTDFKDAFLRYLKPEPREPPS